MDFPKTIRYRPTIWGGEEEVNGPLGEEYVHAETIHAEYANKIKNRISYYEEAIEHIGNRTVPDRFFTDTRLVAPIIIGDLSIKHLIIKLLSLVENISVHEDCVLLEEYQMSVTRSCENDAGLNIKNDKGFSMEFDYQKNGGLSNDVVRLKSISDKIMQKEWIPLLLSLREDAEAMLSYPENSIGPV